MGEDTNYSAGYWVGCCNCVGCRKRRERADAQAAREYINRMARDAEAAMRVTRPLLATMPRRLHLSESERAALTRLLKSYEARVDVDLRKTLASMLERSAPANPKVRYVVSCTSTRAGKRWRQVSTIGLWPKSTLAMLCASGARGRTYESRNRSGSRSDPALPCDQRVAESGPGNRRLDMDEATRTARIAELCDDLAELVRPYEWVAGDLPADVRVAFDTLTLELERLEATLLHEIANGDHLNATQGF